MSQHDFNIANQTASATRGDLNDALVALATASSGTSAPATTFANMMHYNTSDNWLRFRNDADSSWIRFAYFDQSTEQMAIQNDTYIVGTGGDQTGIIGDQTNATWQAGTSTLNSLVSPNRIRLAINSLAPSQSTDYGAVGTYVVARDSTWSGGTRSQGSTISGSSLYATGISTSDSNTSSDPDYHLRLNKIVIGYGTWRLMGYLNNNSGNYNVNSAALYVRIS
jgi:hypothetical protein